MKSTPDPAAAIVVNELKDLRLKLELRKLLGDPELDPCNLLHSVDLARRLLAIDQELARECFAKGCQNPTCTRGTKLYGGDYPRRPRGCAPEVQPYYERKFSANCSICDARVTSPSVRFLGSTWRVSLVLVLTTARGLRSVVWLAEHLGVPERTVRRWRRWWIERFVATKFWDLHAADFAPAVKDEQLPGSALVRFSKATDAVDKLVDFLRFLSPLRPQERGVPRVA